MGNLIVTADTKMRRMVDKKTSALHPALFLPFSEAVSDVVRDGELSDSEYPQRQTGDRFWRSERFPRENSPS